MRRLAVNQQRARCGAREMAPTAREDDNQQTDRHQRSDGGQRTAPSLGLRIQPPRRAHQQLCQCSRRAPIGRVLLSPGQTEQDFTLVLYPETAFQNNRENHRLGYRPQTRIHC